MAKSALMMMSAGQGKEGGGVIPDYSPQWRKLIG